MREGAGPGYEPAGQDPVSTTGSGTGGDPLYSREVRPLCAGYSFGLRGRVGTLGLVVAPASGRARPLLLSSSHVLNRRPDGRPYALYQPAGVDRRGGTARTGPVARAYRFTRLNPRLPNRTEGALASPFGEGRVQPVHPLGALRGVAPRLRNGQTLRKVSRTTGPGVGVVVSVDWAGWVRFGRRRYPFAGQVLVRSEDGPISLFGDSGAVWITEEGELAAMSFAGCRAGTDAVATPAGALLRRLAARLPTPEELERWSSPTPRT